MLRQFALSRFDLPIEFPVWKPCRDHDDCIGFHLGRTARVDAGKPHMVLFYGANAMRQLENYAGLKKSPLDEFLFKRQLGEIRHHG